MANATTTVKPPTLEELAVITNRHQPHWRDGREFCTRDYDEFWPCDAARLNAVIGEAYAAGALAEYREKRRA